MTRAERSGLPIALAGFALLPVGDAVTKSMAGAWSPLAIGALRFLFGLGGLAVLVRVRQGRSVFPMPLPGWQALRGVAIAVGVASFFTALAFMPLGEATVISFVSPMFAAILAASLLGERLDRRTLAAIVLGFAGVVVVLRPNVAAFGWPALLPMIGALASALMIVGNRRTAGHGSVLAMQLYLAMFATPALCLFAAVGAASGSPRFAAHWPEWSVVGRCALVALSASTAHYLIYVGAARAGAAAVAPMSYVQLVVAMALGWAVFGEVPDAAALAGAGIIIVAGMLLLAPGGATAELAAPLTDRDG